MLTVKILFFRSTGSSWLFGLLIRLLTRRRGQALSRTPSHVAVEFQIPNEFPRPADIELYQMICAGCDSSRSPWHRGLMYAVPVSLPDPEAAYDFCDCVFQRQARYDWWAVICDVLGFCLPATVALVDTDSRRYDCSRFVAAALAAGGHSIQETHDPISPNDLYCFLTNQYKETI